MSSPIDIVDLISNNPLSKLSKPYQSKLINKIKHAFDAEEQQIFVASFYCYLNYDSKKDFVIDFDSIWQWLGFSRKDHAKRILENYFKIEMDYIVAHPRAGERKNEGGYNKEQIMLSVKTFKSFCLKAKTDKASQIHEYYIKLEEIFHELLDEESSELRDQLSKTQTLLESTESALRIERENYQKNISRRYQKELPGDVIYIYSSDSRESRPMLKIGKTTHLAERESQFKCSNYHGEVVYAKRCYNCDLLEKVIHHILDKKRVLKFREWFDITFDVAKQVVDSCQFFLDELMSRVEDFPDISFCENLMNLVDATQLSIEPKPAENNKILTKKELQPKDIYVFHEQQKKAEIDNIINTVAKDIKNEDMINPLDFARFIQEACEIDNDIMCLKADMYGAHKLWSRNAENGTKRKVFEYFEKNYKPDKVYFDEHQAKLAVWRGVRPKPMTFVPKNINNPTIFEKFVLERCKLGYTHRSTFKCFFNDYEEWFKKTKPGYTMTIDDRRNLQQYLSETFFPSSVFVSNDLKKLPGGGANCHGIWGVTLKTDNTNTGIKLSNKLRKRIVSVDVATKQIVKVYQSGVEAARDLNIIGSNVSQLIKFKRVRDGLLLRFVEDGDDIPDDDNQ